MTWNFNVDALFLRGILMHLSPHLMCSKAGKKKTENGGGVFKLAFLCLGGQ